jgi:hypothetical protein
MSKSNTVEYRVREVTRFIVTEHDPRANTTTQIAEVDGGGTAMAIAKAFAQACAEEAIAVPPEAPPPGKVMRCKVVLNDRSQAYGQAERVDGKPPGRYTEEPYNYESRGQTVSGVSIIPDQTDPANIVLDGERLSFSAVCPPPCDPNGAEENLIFGQYTPSFQLTAHVRNHSVLGALEKGRAYYVDFTPAPRP